VNGDVRQNFVCPDAFGIPILAKIAAEVMKIRPSATLARSHLKNVFWPPAFGGIGASFQILDIQQYASGMKICPAAILNQNPIFEMASRNLFSSVRTFRIN
jgi:hypothetical protein